MPDFGKRVKALRRANRLTKEALCGDETELSVRQLSRIESGQSTPSLAKVEFIAHQLGVRVGQLTDPETFQLPERYEELKYLLLHTQTYMEPSKISLLEHYFTEIFDRFYDDLPEEEQVVIEVLHSQFELFLDNRNIYSTKRILAEYMAQTQKKTVYQLNDLILLQLYFHYLKVHQQEETLYHSKQHQAIITNLLNLSDQLPSKEIFFLNKVLINACGISTSNFSSPTIKPLISTLDKNIRSVQDFQKVPILNLIKWKYELYTNKDIVTAERYFQDACLFASLTKNDHLLERLNKEWQIDYDKKLD